MLIFFDLLYWFQREQLISYSNYQVSDFLQSSFLLQSGKSQKNHIYRIYRNYQIGQNQICLLCLQYHQHLIFFKLSQELQFLLEPQLYFLILLLTIEYYWYVSIDDGDDAYAFFLVFILDQLLIFVKDLNFSIFFRIILKFRLNYHLIF